MTEVVSSLSLGCRKRLELLRLASLRIQSGRRALTHATSSLYISALHDPLASCNPKACNGCHCILQEGVYAHSSTCQVCRVVIFKVPFAKFWQMSSATIGKKTEKRSNMQPCRGREFQVTHSLSLHACFLMNALLLSLLFLPFCISCPSCPGRRLSPCHSILSTVTGLLWPSSCSIHRRLRNRCNQHLGTWLSFPRFRTVLAFRFSCLSFLLPCSPSFASAPSVVSILPFLCFLPFLPPGSFCYWMAGSKC